MNTSPHLTSGSSAENAIRSKLTASSHPDKIAAFLAPEICTVHNNRVLFQNNNVKAACPVYQRGILESGTIDIGDHQVRTVLMVPHVACPILISHNTLTGVATCLADLLVKNGARLLDTWRGLYGGNSVLPYYRSHEMPASMDLAAAASIGIPIHGGFYSNTTVSGTTAATPQQQVMFRDFTELTNATGGATGLRVLPVIAGDGITAFIEARRSTGAFTLGDLVIRIRTCAIDGTVTSATFTLNAVSYTSGTICAGGSHTIAANQVGLLSLELLSGAAGTVSYDLARIRVMHQVNSVNMSLGSFSGSYVGVPISGINSLLPVCQSARVTALSLKITNTTAVLDANGFIVAVATQNTAPGSCGIYGEGSIASATTAKSYPFVDGCYMALAPAVDLDYSTLDSLPGESVPFGMFIIQTQDNKTITMKLEYHALVEVVSQDPLFAPSMQATDPLQIAALQTAQSGAGYLVLSENPLHWKEIQGVMERANKAVRQKVLPVLNVARNLGVPGSAQTYAATNAVSKVVNVLAKRNKDQNKSKAPQKAPPKKK